MSFSSGQEMVSREKLVRICVSGRAKRSGMQVQMQGHPMEREPRLGDVGGEEWDLFAP